MSKNNNTIIWIIGIAILIIFILPKLGLFSINLITPNEIITSNYIIKLGLISSFQWTNSNEVDSINQAINNIYGVGIFDTPITMDSNTKNELISMMNEINSDSLEETQTSIFSQNLINLVNKNSFSSNDLQNLITELDNSLNNACNSLSNIDLTKLSDDEKSNYNSIKNWCNDKSPSIFIKNGNSYTLSLKDISLITSSSSSNCSIDLQTGINVCQIIPITTTQTISLSKIKLKLSVNTADSLIVGIGDKGISEADGLDSKYEFNQYAYSIEHNNSLDFSQSNLATGYSSYPIYTVASNSQEVVSASNGEIKDSGIMDLWYGIKGGRAFTDWRFIIILVGILVVFLLIRK